MTEHWLMIDGRPARVLRYEDDFIDEYLCYERPGCPDGWLRITGTANRHRVVGLRRCAGCGQPLDSRDCALSVARWETGCGVCMICDALGTPADLMVARHETEKYGMRVTT